MGIGFAQIISSLDTQSLVILSVLSLMFMYLSRQFNLLKKDVSIVKEGSWAGLKNDLKNVHKDCVVCEEKGKSIPQCYLELFYSTKGKFDKYNIIDGQVDFWAKDIDRMTASQTKIKRTKKWQK